MAIPLPLRVSHPVRVLALVGLLLPVGAADSPTLSTFRNPGMGVDWCPSTDLVAYDFQNAATGYWQVNICHADGTGDLALSPGVPGLPTKTNGSPAWFPDGSFVVVATEKQEHPGSSSAATP